VERGLDLSHKKEILAIGIFLVGKGQVRHSLTPALSQRERENGRKGRFTVFVYLKHGKEEGCLF
jgi:hypothetical protein